MLLGYTSPLVALLFLAVLLDAAGRHTKVGLEVGDAEGYFEGLAVGKKVGNFVGMAVGLKLGAVLGIFVGLLVGFLEVGALGKCYINL